MGTRKSVIARMCKNRTSKGNQRVNRWFRKHKVAVSRCPSYRKTPKSPVRSFKLGSHKNRPFSGPSFSGINYNSHRQTFKRSVRKGRGSRKRGSRKRRTFRKRIGSRKRRAQRRTKHHRRPREFQHTWNTLARQHRDEELNI